MRNEGDAALDLTLPLTLGSGSSSDFSILEQPAKATLQPNERTHLVLRYTAPAVYNDATANLDILSNDAANCSFSFEVGATSVPSTPAYEILCDGNVIFPVAFETFSDAPAVNLGSVMLGDCGEGPISKTFTIRNNTDQPLNVIANPFCGAILESIPAGTADIPGGLGGPFFDGAFETVATSGNDFEGDSEIISIIGEDAGDFSVTTQPPSTIAAGGTVDFVIEFNPSAAGASTKLAELCFDISFQVIDGLPLGGDILIPISGVSTNCPIEFASNNELMFQDPCACDDPRNCASGGMTLFHDTLTVTGASGLTLTAVAGATDFFSAVECFGGANTVIPAGTAIPETPAGSGMYKIEFWRPSGAVPTLMVNDGTTNHTVPASTFEPVCTDAMCIPTPPIPTMSEWGLMLFGLLIINLGVFFVRKQEIVLK